MLCSIDESDYILGFRKLYIESGAKSDDSSLPDMKVGVQTMLKEINSKDHSKPPAGFKRPL